MKDLIFIDIVVEHMQKMHKQITCESKEIDIMSKIGNQFVLKAKTVNEIMVLSDLLKLLTGMTRSELTKEIRMREIQTIKEIDEYVKIKKDLLEENKNQFAIAGEQDVVSALKEFFKDQPNVHVVDVSKKPIIFEIEGSEKEFQKLWNNHTEQNHLTEQMNVDLKNKGKIIENSIHLDRLEKIKEIIPVINDNFVLKQRLEDLKKVEQRLKKLPKSQRGQLTEIQKQINTIKSWL